MKNIINIILTATIVSLGAVLTGCKNMIEVDLPVNKITSEAAFSQNGTSISFVTGTYTVMGNNLLGGFLSLSYLSGLSADELKVLDAQSYQMFLSCYRNRLTSQDLSNSTPEYWNTLYDFVYRANTAIEGLTKSETLTPSIKQYLIGEAKFMRAYSYFYLINLYGDVPLLLTSDWRTNSSTGRLAKDRIYEQIIIDLKEAKELLPSYYMDGDLRNITEDRVRPTKWAALSMLSRVYLYTGKYFKEAEEASTEVINNGTFELPDLGDVFLRTSKEVIWSIQPTDPGRNTQEAQRMFLTGVPTTNVLKPFFLSSELISAFEVNDPRRTVWTNNYTSGNTTYYGAAKYKALNAMGGNHTEYSVLLRLGEVYLNRAEARARQNKIRECIEDLNKIRQRARGKSDATTLPDYSVPLSQAQAIEACLKERRIELFSELGHRWLDIKRVGTIDDVMRTAALDKGTTWDSNWALYPIPIKDLTYNPTLTGHQNPGY